jgi:hypothetical protein
VVVGTAVAQLWLDIIAIGIRTVIWLITVAVAIGV